MCRGKVWCTGLSAASPRNSTSVLHRAEQASGAGRWGGVVEGGVQLRRQFQACPRSTWGCLLKRHVTEALELPGAEARAWRRRRMTGYPPPIDCPFGNRLYVSAGVTVYSTIAGPSRVTMSHCTQANADGRSFSPRTYLLHRTPISSPTLKGISSHVEYHACSIDGSWSNLSFPALMYWQH